MRAEQLASRQSDILDTCPCQSLQGVPAIYDVSIRDYLSRSAEQLTSRFGSKTEHMVSTLGLSFVRDTLKILGGRGGHAEIIHSVIQKAREVAQVIAVKITDDTQFQAEIIAFLEPDETEAQKKLHEVLCVEVSTEEPTGSLEELMLKHRDKHSPNAETIVRMELVEPTGLLAGEEKKLRINQVILPLSDHLRVERQYASERITLVLLIVGQDGRMESVKREDMQVDRLQNLIERVLSRGYNAMAMFRDVPPRIESSHNTGTALMMEDIRRIPEIRDILESYSLPDIKGKILARFIPKHREQVVKLLDSLPETAEQFIRTMVAAIQKFESVASLAMGYGREVNHAELARELRLFLLYNLMPQHPENYAQFAKGEKRWLLSDSSWGQRQGVAREIQKSASGAIGSIRGRDGEVTARLTGKVNDGEVAQATLLNPVGKDMKVTYEIGTLKALRVIAQANKSKSDRDVFMGVVQEMLSNFIEYIGNALCIESPVTARTKDEVKALPAEHFELTPKSYFHLSHIVGKELASIFETVINHFNSEHAEKCRELRDKLRATGIIIPELRTSSSVSYAMCKARSMGSDWSGFSAASQDASKATAELAGGDLEKLGELLKFVRKDDLFGSIVMPDGVTLASHLEAVYISLISLAARFQSLTLVERDQLVGGMKQFLGTSVHLATHSSASFARDVLFDPGLGIGFQVDRGHVHITRAAMNSHPVRIIRPDVPEAESKWTIGNEVTISTSDSSSPMIAHNIATSALSGTRDQFSFTLHGRSGSTTLRYGEALAQSKREIRKVDDKYVMSY